MIVVDASVVCEALLNTPRAAAVNDRLFAPGETLQAPHLMDIEVIQVLRRHVAAGLLDPGRGGLAVANLQQLPVTRHSHTLLLSRIWQLRANLTAYDAAYVALAEALDCPLFTCDRRLAAAPGQRARIVLA